MFKMPFRRQPQKLQAKFRFTNLKSQHIYLRFPVLGDYNEWAKLRIESRAFLEPWEPLWPDDAHTLDRYKEHLARFIDGRNDGVLFVFFVFSNEADNLIGGISLRKMKRNVLQSGEIGYWCGEKYSGHGFMHESLDLVIDFAFHELNLPRLEASANPTNRRSMALLENCGFSKQGLMRSCVKIHGDWLDHYLYSLLRTERPLKSA